MGVAYWDRFRAARAPVALLAAFLCVARPEHAGEGLKLPAPTSEQRSDDIRRAQVCEATDIPSKDLYNGPRGELKFAVDEEVSCEFVPKQMKGLTQKFLCRFANGRVYKVKYNEGRRFKEVYGEVLGTRLFWALGFYADRMLPVRVTCVGCPKRAWEYVRAGRHRSALDEHGLLTRLPRRGRSRPPPGASPRAAAPGQTETKSSPGKRPAGGVRPRTGLSSITPASDAR